ncbi:hypothetical protein AVEN_222224-1 [Araneus ventricosus]|uniref:Uncharacterized protein n=1 Tax=Araneus ventricosus TaxID=182803 RepID=A0A4Y2J9H3_ARAVE|nr:hypothetical protein AVEN_222224-1 [Araneus ventricosus]
MVSRMVCKDGMALSLFCSSSELRYLFSKSGFHLPNSPNTIRSIVTNFENTVKDDLIIEFEYLKKQGKIFALTFDEWTPQKNHRYLSLNVHHKERHFNLGLIRIHGSCIAEHTNSLIKKTAWKASVLILTLILIYTDGASVMVKVSKLMSCYLHLCFAHRLQLAGVDILYKKNIEREEKYQEITSNKSDTDDVDTNDTREEQGVTVTTTTDLRHLHLSRAEVIPRYNDLLQKVRKVVKLFKRSPTK